MGTPQGTGPSHASPAGWRRAQTAGWYLLLFLPGVLQGGIGSFQYSQPPAPLIAIACALAIFVTCLACGWGTGSVTAGLLPAVGWVVASFVVAMPRANGSVVITATAAGEWYLYGGALGCVIGVLATLVLRTRRSLASASR